MISALKQVDVARAFICPSCGEPELCAMLAGGPWLSPKHLGVVLPHLPVGKKCVCVCFYLV